MLKKNRTHVRQDIEKKPVHVCFLQTEIENGIICHLRKVTKAKVVFPTDDILLKMLYLAIMDIKNGLDGGRAGVQSILGGRFILPSVCLRNIAMAWAASSCFWWVV